MYREHAFVRELVASAYGEIATFDTLAEMIPIAKLDLKTTTGSGCQVSSYVKLLWNGIRMCRCGEVAPLRRVDVIPRAVADELKKVAAGQIILFASFVNFARQTAEVVADGDEVKVTLEVRASRYGVIRGEATGAQRDFLLPPFELFVVRAIDQSGPGLRVEVAEVAEFAAPVTPKITDEPGSFANHEGLVGASFYRIQRGEFEALSAHPVLRAFEARSARV
jgi:hypothetical protein